MDTEVLTKEFSDTSGLPWIRIITIIKYFEKLLLIASIKPAQEKL